MNPKLNRLLTPFLSLSILISLAATASAASRPVDGVGPPQQANPPLAEVAADRNGNRMFDDLEGRMSSVPEAEAFPVIILFNEPLGRIDLAGMHRQTGSFVVQRRFHIIDGLAATLTKGQIVAASRLPFVKHVQLDRPVQATLDTSTHWFGVKNARLPAPAGWGVTGDTDDVGGAVSYSKNDVVVAIVDTGIAASHGDLDGGKVIGWYDVVGGKPDPYDDHGHGTHVSSMVAGEGQGNASYTGVAPGAALVGVKVLDQNGSGNDSGVIEGVQWAIDNKATYGIRVMNLSLGNNTSSNGQDALSLAMNAAANSGIVPVVAAGNSGPFRGTIGSPAAAAMAVTVGAMADVGENGFSVAGFSSRGPTADGRRKPDILAPGVAITAAKAGTTNDYVTYSGTSMATPFVAGVVALMLDGNASLSPADVKGLLEQTAIDWGPQGADGDIDMGAGRLDAYRAIGEAVTGQSLAGEPTVPAPPPHEFHKDGYLGQDDEQAWHNFDVTDTASPLAVTLIVPNAECALALFGMCFEGTYDYDLELYAPTGELVAYSNLPDRQDTINILPSKVGTYRARVYVCSGCGFGTGYWLEASGARFGTATNEQPIKTGSIGLNVVKLSKGRYQASALVSVVDGNGAAVGGASVKATWTLNGSVLSSSQGTTDANGRVTLRTAKFKGQAGRPLAATVTDIQKSGYLFQAGNDTASIVLPP